MLGQHTLGKEVYSESRGSISAWSNVVLAEDSSSSLTMKDRWAMSIFSDVLRISPRSSEKIYVGRCIVYQLSSSVAFPFGSLSFFLLIVGLYIYSLSALRTSVMHFDVYCGVAINVVAKGCRILLFKSCQYFVTTVIFHVS